MYLHGKPGLRYDIVSLCDSTKHDAFVAKYGQEFTDLCLDHFIFPLIHNSGDTVKQKHVVGKLDLFCAAFINEI